MNKLLLTIACAAALAVSSFASTEDNKLVIKFAPGTDIQKEIADADAFLADNNSPASLDPEYQTTPDGLVFELIDGDAATLKELVEGYFPSDANVLSVDYSTDATDTENELNDVKESSSDVQGGKDVIGEVELSKPAKAGGEKVEIESSDNKTANVPSYVLVPQGQTRVQFKIHTNKKVAKSSIVQIRSHLNGKTLSMNLKVRK